MWLLTTADLPSSCPFGLLVNRFAVTNRLSMGSSTCWNTELRPENLEAGWASLFKALLLGTVQVQGSKKASGSRDQRNKHLPVPGLYEVQRQCNIQRMWIWPHVREGGERQQVQPKEWKYLIRIAFKVWLYFKKQYNNGTRRLYVLPVLIPIAVVLNKETKRLFC